MAIQLLNERFTRSSKIKNLLLTYYASLVLKYPKLNKRHIKEAVRKTVTCRTEANGCRVYKCPIHSVFRIVPHSCGHRFCTICSSFKTERWVNAKIEFLSSINTPYYFMTITVPGPISRFIQENKELLLGKVFYATSHGLLGWCQKKRNFTPGIVMILQTSGDTLNYHVHIHLLITCGGLREEKEWVTLSPRKREKPRNGKKFHPAFPPQVISRRFKSFLYRALRKAYQTEGFNVPTEYLESAATFEDFNSILKKWWNTEWNLDVSDPLRSAREILEYIARYIKKPPISNRRIIEINEEKGIIRFLAKNRESRNKKAKKIEVMSIEYFILCLLEHVPLDRFPLIRWYGIFSNRKKKELMPIVEKLIPSSLSTIEGSPEEKKEERAVEVWRRLHLEAFGVDPLACPICGRELQLAAVFYPNQLPSMNLSFEQVPQFLMN